MKKNPKIMLIHTLPSPYRNPLLERLDKQPNFDIEVFFMARGAKNRIWKHGDLNFKHRFLSGTILNLKQGDDTLPIWINPTITWEIVKGRFDMVICTGWDSLTTPLAWVTCKLLGIPVVIWSGSTAYEKSWRRSIMSLPVKVLVQGADALISYGSASKEYLEMLGAKAQKIFIMFNCVDIDFFRKISLNNKNSKEKIKKQLSIKNKNLIIFVGQLITRKGVLDLYETVEEIRKNSDVGILWVGYGELKEELEKRGKEDKFLDQYFVTTYTSEETAKMYSIADFLVIPTYEDIFSNVVAEGLASGLPVITTYENGASRDLIKSGQNGFTIKAGDQNDLKDKINILINDKTLRDKMSNNTWKFIKDFNYGNNITSFNKLLSYLFKD